MLEKEEVFELQNKWMVLKQENITHFQLFSNDKMKRKGLKERIRTWSVSFCFFGVTMWIVNAKISSDSSSTVFFSFDCDDCLARWFDWSGDREVSEAEGAGWVEVWADWEELTFSVMFVGNEQTHAMQEVAMNSLKTNKLPPHKLEGGFWRQTLFFFPFHTPDFISFP